MLMVSQNRGVEESVITRGGVNQKREAQGVRFTLLFLEHSHVVDYPVKNVKA